MKNLKFSVTISYIIPLFLVFILVSCGSGLETLLGEKDPREDYDYIRLVTINNPTAGDLINYQVNLNFDPTSFTDLDLVGADLRFYKGSKKLAYWIEDIDWATPSASVWVNINLLTPGDNNIEVLYGNASANPGTNFDSTFTKDHYGSTASPLVGLWRMDEGSGIVISDESGNSNNGARTITTDWVQEPDGLWDSISGTETVLLKNWSLKFDNSNDYVLVNDNPTLNLSDVTIEAWIKTGSDVSSAQSQYIVSKWNELTDNISYALAIKNSEFIFSTSSTGDILSIDNLYCSTVLPDTWYHLVLMASGAGKSIVINGGAERCDDFLSTDGVYAGSAANLVFGRKNEFSSSPFGGVIDEVAIFDGALTDPEILAHSERRKYVPGIVVSIGVEFLN